MQTESVTAAVVTVAKSARTMQPTASPQHFSAIPFTHAPPPMQHPPLPRHASNVQAPQPAPQLSPPYLHTGASSLPPPQHRDHLTSQTSHPPVVSSQLSPAPISDPQLARNHLRTPSVSHSPRPTPQLTSSQQLTSPHDHTFPPVLPSLPALSGPLSTPCQPISALHQQRRRPQLPNEPHKFRRLESTSHVSPVRRLNCFARSPAPVVKHDYETVSARGDNYSTGSRETAAVPDSFDEDEPETPFTCAHCAARFCDKEQRKAHIKSAHAKPFFCTVCHSRFTRKFDLEKHSLTVHEGMRPFKCDVCHSSFGQKHHLVRHKRAVHAKARDFACDSCSSRFARKEHLGNHKRAVHDKYKPYMCSLCDVQYCERRALRRHLETVHSVKATRAPVLVEWQPNGKELAPSIVDLLQM